MQDSGAGVSELFCCELEIATPTLGIITAREIHIGEVLLEMVHQGMVGTNEF